MRIFSLVLALLVPAAAGAKTVCDPEPELKLAVDALFAKDDTHRLTADEKGAHRQALEQLSRAHPTDWYADSRLQDLVRDDVDAMPSLISAYTARAAKQPTDVVAQYLHARIADPQEALSLAEKTLRLDANFQPTQLLLARVYRTQENRAAALAAVRAYLLACPDSVRGYRAAANILPPTERKLTAQKLRKLFTTATDPDDFTAFASLWQLEFGATPLAQQAALRRVVANDIKRLRAIPNSGSMLLGTIAQGAKLNGDSAAVKAIEDEALSQYPVSAVAKAAVHERCRIPATPPSENSTLEEAQKYYLALYRASDEWIKQYPNQAVPWAKRLSAMLHLREVSTAEVETVANQAAKLGDPDDTAATLSEAYLQRDIHLADVPKLVKKANAVQMKFIDDFIKRAPASYVKELKRERELLPIMEHVTLAEAYTKLKDGAKAASEVAAIDKWLAETPLKSATDPDDKNAVKGIEHFVQARKARLFALQGHALDALAYGRAALALAHDAEERDELTTAMRQWWKSLGGTEPAFLLWTTAAAEKKPREGEWKAPEKPLAAFDLIDLKGKHFRLNELRGKVVLINLWATWCGPCKEELPHVQELWEKVRSRKDVVLLSFNVDANPGLVEPFLKEHKLELPIIPAVDFVQEMLGSLSIPRTWIVDKNGKLVREQIGFNPSAPWVEDVLAILDKAQSGAL